VHEVQHKPTKKIIWGTLQSLKQKQVLVLPVAHRTLSGAKVEAPRELAALGFSLKITGLSGEPTEQWSTSPAVDCEQCRSQKLERTGLSGAARGQRTSTVNRSKPQ
jgi:hypothetical protein